MSSITRKEYLASKRPNIHREYHSQFVTDETVRHIRNYFTADQLAEALEEDVHLNSIKLEVWDKIVSRPTDKPNRPGVRTSGFITVLPVDREAINTAGESVTMATLVCIAKEAARQIVESANADANA